MTIEQMQALIERVDQVPLKAAERGEEQVVGRNYSAKNPAARITKPSGLEGGSRK